MKELNVNQLKRRIRIWIIIFMIALVLSGITAFPIEMELRFLVNHLNIVPGFMRDFITGAYQGVSVTSDHFPFMSYGTDWLAFAHIVIAIAFIGPYFNPVKNVWVIQFGMIACALVIVLALIAGPIRGIPVYWRIMDCSFGIIGFVPLYIIYRLIKKLERFKSHKPRRPD